MDHFLAFEATTDVAAEPADLFDFHGNPANIRAIAPPSLHVLEVVASDIPLEGSEFRMKVRQWGVTIRWIGRWEQVVAPSLLVDTAVESPFAFWRHEHIFERAPSGSRLTDRVTVCPRGGTLAALLMRPFLRTMLASMFRQRHRATRNFFDRH